VGGRRAQNWRGWAWLHAAMGEGESYITSVSLCLPSDECWVWNNFARCLGGLFTYIFCMLVGLLETSRQKPWAPVFVFPFTGPEEDFCLHEV
jgi:hypothetical protein